MLALASAGPTPAWDWQGQQGRDMVDRGANFDARRALVSFSHGNLLVCHPHHLTQHLYTQACPRRKGSGFGLIWPACKLFQDKVVARRRKVRPPQQPASLSLHARHQPIGTTSPPRSTRQAIGGDTPSSACLKLLCKSLCQLNRSRSSSGTS